MLKRTASMAKQAWALRFGHKAMLAIRALQGSEQLKSPAKRTITQADAFREALCSLLEKPPAGRLTSRNFPDTQIAPGLVLFPPFLRFAKERGGVLFLFAAVMPFDALNKQQARGKHSCRKIDPK